MIQKSHTNVMVSSNVMEQSNQIIFSVVFSLSVSSL
jgi:hypothetical protein